MELRLWEYGQDDSMIPSFLEGMSLAHKEPVRSVEWFHWKFEQSPYGKAFMACAIEDGKIAGCVAYGRGVLHYQGKPWKSALSYETFVHPSYQGHGLFKKLIALAEEEMVRSGVQFLYNFPNSNSLAGFCHMGWTARNDIKSFKIKIRRPFGVLFRITDLKKPFVPNKSNLDSIRGLVSENLPYFEQTDDILNPVWNSDYLKWRFFTFPNREYLVIDNDDFFSISMIGFRGRIKSAHILYFVSKKQKSQGIVFRDVLRKVSSEARPDVVEYSSTIFDKSHEKVCGFIKVPSNSNFCYKVLDNSLVINEFKMVLPSINAHTY